MNILNTILGKLAGVKLATPAPAPTIFILGARDPEMEQIIRLLKYQWIRPAYAGRIQANGEVDFSPAGVYQANAIFDENGRQVEMSPKEMRKLIEGAFLVECDFPGIEPKGRCDHHRPGDPGFGLPPEQFWQASSLGQVAGLLHFELPVDGRCSGCQRELAIAAENWGSETPIAESCCDGKKYLAPSFGYTAAADHCLAAAYAGRCPGIDPESLREYRIEQLCSASRASNRGGTRTPDEVRASIARAECVVRDAPEVKIGGVAVKDLRRIYECTSTAPQCGWFADNDAIPYCPTCGNSFPRLVGALPDLPDAAMACGVAYLAGGVPLRAGEAAKLVLGGAGKGTLPGITPVDAFLAAAASGKIAGTPVVAESAYGDPVRGFAGVTICQ